MKLDVIETRDAAVVWAISQHESVRARVTDDKLAAFPAGVQSEVLRQVVQDPKNHTLAVRVNGRVVGCFLFDQTQPGTFEVHTMMLPDCRGLSAIVAGRKAVKWMFSQGAACKLVSYCPMKHREILFFALRCGFKKMETIIGGWIQNGEATDLVRVETNYIDNLVCH